MKKINIVINGFGRIGRAVLRHISKKNFVDKIFINDAPNTLEHKKYYVIIPNSKFLNWNIKDYKKSDKSFKFCSEGFSYNSKTNKIFLKPSEIKKIINLNIKDINQKTFLSQKSLKREILGSNIIYVSAAHTKKILNKCYKVADIIFKKLY